MSQQQGLSPEEVLAATIETSYDGIVISDAEGTIVQANSSYERITGISRDQVVGRHGRDLVKDGVLSEYLADRIITSRQPVMTVQRYRTGRSAVIVGNPMLGADKRIRMIVFNLRDVTELHALRSELSATQADSARYRTEALQLRVATGELGDIVFQSRRMVELMQLTLVLAQVDSSVLLLGESGVGKGVLARTLHNQSPRAAAPFISVNCAALPESLLEAELFGYMGGAFTGALSQGKPGLFEVADCGTLFLDEIGEMSPGVQAKLLHVVQDREVRRIGATQSRPVNVRLISATNRDLEESVRLGKFREDLYYRLSVVPVLIPPLRERPEDIVALLDYFLTKVCQRYKITRHFTNEAITRLLAYKWPGNVRELENLVERLAVTAPEPAISAADLPPGFHGARQDARVLVSGLMNLDSAKEELERQLYCLAARELRTTRKVAAALGVSQPTAARQIKRYTGDSSR